MYSATLNFLRTELLVSEGERRIYRSVKRWTSQKVSWEHSETFQTFANHVFAADSTNSLTQMPDFYTAMKKKYHPSSTYQSSITSILVTNVRIAIVGHRRYLIWKRCFLKRGFAGKKLLY